MCIEQQVNIFFDIIYAYERHFQNFYNPILSFLNIIYKYERAKGRRVGYSSFDLLQEIKSSYLAPWNFNKEPAGIILHLQSVPLYTHAMET